MVIAIDSYYRAGFGGNLVIGWEPACILLRLFFIGRFDRVAGDGFLERDLAEEVVDDVPSLNCSDKQ